MRTLVALALISALTGCSADNGSKPIPPHLITQTASVPVDPWQLRCTNDNHGTAPRRCSLSRADMGGLVMVSFVDRKGPYLSVGTPTYPGRPNPSRVDNGPVLDAAKNGEALVKAALTGKKLYGSYTMWPSGEVLVTDVDLEGFPEAYAKLRAML